MPRVSARDVLYRDAVGDERLMLDLARAIHASRSDAVATSWTAQVEAEGFINTYGVKAAREECARLERLRRPTACN